MKIGKLKNSRIELALHVMRQEQSTKNLPFFIAFHHCVFTKHPTDHFNLKTRQSTTQFFVTYITHYTHLPLSFNYVQQHLNLISNMSQQQHQCNQLFLILHTKKFGKLQISLWNPHSYSIKFYHVMLFLLFIRKE